MIKITLHIEGLLVICLLFGQVNCSGEQCTTGWYYRHCYDNYKYINGRWIFLDECCKMKGTWYCVADAKLHPCEERGFTTTALPQRTSTTRMKTTDNSQQTTSKIPYSTQKTTTIAESNWYTTKSRTNLVVPVAVTVAGFVITMATFLVCCAVFIRRKRRQQNRNQTFIQGTTQPQTINPIHFERGSAEQCTTDGLVEQNCNDNYTYKNGQRELADQCCFMNGTWFCVSEADIHQCESRSYTTDLLKGNENTTENPTGSRTTGGEIVRNNNTTNSPKVTENPTENPTDTTIGVIVVLSIFGLFGLTFVSYGFWLSRILKRSESEDRSRSDINPNYITDISRAPIISAPISREEMHRRDRTIRHFWELHDNVERELYSINRNINAQNSLSSYDNQTNGHISNVSHIGDGYFIYTGYLPSLCYQTSDTANNLSTISDGNINIRDGPPSYYSLTNTRDVTLLSRNDTLNSQEDPPSYYDQSNRIVVGVSHISNSALNIQGDPPSYDDPTTGNDVGVGSVINQDGNLSSHPLDDLPSYYDVFIDEQISLPHDKLQSDDENYPAPDY